MSKKDIVYLLMILNVNTYANAILKPSLRANENHIGINEYTDHDETNLDANERICSVDEQQKV